MNRLNIRTWLTLWYTLMLTLFSVAGFFAVYHLVNGVLLEESQSVLRMNSAIITADVEYNEFRDRLEFDIDGALPDNIMYSLYSVDEEWIDGGRAAWVDDIGVGEGIRTIEHDGVQWLVQDTDVDYNGRYAGYARILLSLGHIPPILTRILRTGLLAVIPCLALFGIGGFFIAGRGLAPVKRITKAAGEIGQGDFSHRLEPGKADDEVAQLARVFNRMAENLQQSFGREKRFSSDASHQLRTPLSVIIGTSGHALEADEQEIYRKSMAVINERGRQMQVLLAKLLMMARGEDQMELSDIDLSAFMEDLAGEYALLAQERGITISTDITPNVLYRADQTLFLQMMLNIMDNAVKYCDKGGEIGITLHYFSLPPRPTGTPPQEGNNAVKISVKNSAEGIYADDLAHIFERFYRGSKGQQTSGGYGLGLPLAQRVAELHGGTITADASEDWVVVTIHFPYTIRASL